MRAGQRLEFLEAGKFTFVGALVIEMLSKNDLYGPQGARDAAGHPNLAVSAHADMLQHGVIRDLRRFIGDGPRMDG